MNSIGTKIIEIRKSRGLNQEELAELSKVNLRTIQRIENNENVPRGKTLDLICNALEIDRNCFTRTALKNKSESIGSFIINGVYLILLNLLLMSIIGFLTLDSNANINSRTGALLLSFFVPFFIVLYTQKMTPLERVLKFGIGLLVYIGLLLIVQGFKEGFSLGLRTGLYLCSILSVGVLYYGKAILKLIK
ncbi:helix-turn-helix domain-containing protein [Hwangdonia lutea]|uniref:Helix-turn-helix transcriptional regulator n=1 Tax=Hwangdonia lutea TaxID=3075823 RepID=A0AA97ELN9_9FLAO|nr:helix-turn-helix transcriptional regulator [Hwangdonia sp. SCSIO 19198]WOD43721.1 helix-turn-helix transcriptional regulator [Hwangdonia sp. SCSIO 19198]